MTETDVVVSVVIPNYNGKEFINVCLDSIARQTYRSFETIVVDDASLDDSCKFIGSHYPWVHLIRLERNAGFCHAVNTGIAGAQGDYIALINNDVELDSDWLTVMLAAAGALPDTFGISSKVLNFYERAMIDDAGDVYTREGRAFKRWNGLPDVWFNAEREEVFSPAGAASLISKAALNTVGYWDERFIAYLDDVDIGFRARLMGYKNYYEPRAVAYHMVSRTYGKKTVFMGALVLRNNLAVIIKNMPFPLMAALFPWLMIGHLKTLKYIFSTGGVRAVLQGYGMFLRMIPHLLTTRQSIKRKTAITVKALKRAIFKKYDYKTGKYVAYV